jgi:prepilin-type processing-associated H-X9-DG protein
MNLAPKDATNAFVRMDPERTSGWGRDVAAAADRKTGAFVVADKGRLVRFEPAGDVYKQTAERDLEIDKSAVVGQGGGRGIVAFADGSVRLFDAVTLAEAASFKLPTDDPPRAAEVSPDGRHAAVLTHGGRLTLYDAKAGKPLDASVQGQGDVSAVAFAPDGSLWAADRLKRLTRYDAETLEPKETLEGSLSTSEMIYRYALRPLQWLLPNTYGLRNAQAYLFTDRKAEAVGGPDAPLESERLTFDVWGPIWQNTAFLTVILALTCAYIARKDF